MTTQEPRSRLSDFLGEMRRRHVVRFAFGYAAAAFVVLQLAEIVFPAFGLGESSLRILVIVVALGFPPATVLAWVFDLTSEGIQRTEGSGADTLLPRIALLVVTVGVMSGLGVWLAARGAFSAPSADRDGPAIALAEYDPSAPIRSVAVLPLQDFSEGGGQAYFTSGMHEELIAKLSKIEGLRVVSRTSVMRYQGTTKPAPVIGRELGVDALVEGSVTRAGNRVRITLQVIHAASDSHIETLQFDRELTNILALQSEVAHAVALEVAGEHDDDPLSRVAMNSDVGAQEAYLKGKFEYDKGTGAGYERALSLFDEAVQTDPDFAPALAGLASARFMVDLNDGRLDPVQVRQARDEAAAAVQADSTSVEAMEVLSFIERSMPRVVPQQPPLDDAVSQVRVIRVPGAGDSIVMDLASFDTTWVTAMTSLGQRLEETMRERSIALGDETPSREAFAARQLMLSGRFTEAADLLERLVEDSPEDADGWEALMRSHVSAGQPRQAVSAARRWTETGTATAPDAAAVDSLARLVTADGASGYWAWTLERLQSRQDGGEPVPQTEIAAAYAGVGEDDRAIEHLFEAMRRGERGLLGLRSDPVWDDLRRDERFAQIAREARALRFSPALGRRPPASGDGRGGGR